MKKDLVILVPDKNTQFVLNGLLSRTQSLKIREIDYQIYLHPERDPGVFHRSDQFLRPFHSEFEKALIFMDREGSGQENKSAQEIGHIVKSKVEKVGWGDKIEVIVFDPELEIWAWTKSPHLAKHLGWDNITELVSFVKAHGYWTPSNEKPERPKEAVEIALREKHIPRSSAIYKKIAETVSFESCQESSFLKFKQIMRSWFPATN